MYSPTLPLTSALDRVGGQHHDSAVLLGGKRPGTLSKEAGRDPGQVRTDAEILAFTEIRTYYAIPVQFSY
jgi:hypothetical protein